MRVSWSSLKCSSLIVSRWPSYWWWRLFARPGARDAQRWSRLHHWVSDRAHPGILNDDSPTAGLRGQDPDSTQRLSVAVSGYVQDSRGQVLVVVEAHVKEIAR